MEAKLRVVVCALLALSAAWGQMAAKPGRGEGRPAGAGGRRDATAAAPRGRFLWPDGIIPYVIDEQMPNRQNVLDAMKHWSERTPVRFVERQTEANYVHFRDAGATCMSSVGMVGGEQFIDLPAAVCSLTNTIHEIGHAVGFFHEHSRTDRDRYVRFYAENAAKGLAGQYQPQISNGEDLGPFDYGSIMLYGRYSNARAAQLATLESIPPGIAFGQATGLSAQEIETVGRWYGKPSGRTVVTSVPAGLKLVVDGAECTAPCSFDWTAGETHRIEAPGPQTGPGFRYVFGRWSDEGTASHTITVSAGTPVYTAAFIRQYRLTVAGSENGTVTVSPLSADGYYTEGTEVTVTATANANWYFGGWSGAPLPSFQGGVHGWGENPVTFRVTYPDMKYVALFERRKPYLIVTDPPHLRVILDGATQTTPVAVVWTQGSQHTIEAPANTLAGTGVRHVFQGWSDGGERSHTVTAAAEGSTLTASYRTQYRVTAAVSPDSAGAVTVTPASPDGFHDAGTALLFTAAPAALHCLTNWSGDLAGGGDTRSVTAAGEMLVTANFAGAFEIPYNGVVHGASLQPGAVSPGQVVTIYGCGVGPPSEVQSGGATPATVPAGTRVTFDGVTAPVLSAASGRVTVVAPASVAGRTSTWLQVDYHGKTTNPVILEVVDAAPALYSADGSGVGQVQATHADGSVNSVSRPAARGAVVSLLATGLGSADAPLAAENVAAEIDGQPAEVIATATTQTAGILRVDVKVPASARSGSVPVCLLVNSHPSPPGMTLAIE